MNHSIHDLLDTSSAPELNSSMQRLARIHQERTALAQPFYDTLEWMRKRIDYQPPTSGITYVLSINSGFGHDVVALNSFFGSRPNGLANEATHVYCIERSTPQYQAARQHNSRISYRDQELVIQPADYLHFLNCDPVELSEQKLPGQFHAIVIRHLDISNDDYPWELILHNALDLLAPNGIAITTTFNNTVEDLTLRRFFFDPNYEVLLHDNNPMSHPIKESIVELDAIISVVRKADSYQKPATPPMPAAYTPGIVNQIITREVFAFPMKH